MLKLLPFIRGLHIGIRVVLCIICAVLDIILFTYIYAAHDDAAGSSLAPDKVAAATDEVRSKYGATDISTGSSEVPYPTTGTCTSTKM